MPCLTERTIAGPLAILLLSPGLAPANAALSQKRTDPQPALVIDRSRHDFGVVFAGEVLSCVFNVRNMGGKTLELSESASPAPPSNEKPPSKPRAPVLKVPSKSSAYSGPPSVRAVAAKLTAANTVLHRYAAAAPS